MQLEKKVINISGQRVWLMPRHFIFRYHYPFAHVDKTSVTDSCMVEGDRETSQFHMSEFREAPVACMYLRQP